MHGTKNISWESIPAPSERMPPIEVCVEIPISESAPDVLQSELLNQIRAEFPALWKAALGDLHDYGLDVFRNAEIHVTGGAIFIPSWDHTDHEADEERSMDNYVWEMSPSFSGAQELEESLGIQATFCGLTLLPPVTVFW